MDCTGSDSVATSRRPASVLLLYATNCIGGGNTVTCERIVKQLRESGLSCTCLHASDVLSIYLKQHQDRHHQDKTNPASQPSDDVTAHQVTLPADRSTSRPDPQTPVGPSHMPPTSDPAALSRHQACSSVPGDGAEHLALDWYCQTNQIDCIIAVHAHRCRKFLIGCSFPFSIVFGGTDINRDSHDLSLRAEMTPAILQARRLVSFTRAMRDRAVELWPSCSTKVYIQKHGVEAVLTPPEDVRDLLGWTRNLAGPSRTVPDNAKIFMLVAGIRPVKDPLFLANIMDAWHQKDASVFLVIIGAKLDEECFSAMQERLARSTAVFYSDAVPQPFLHHLLRQSSGLVNTSLSEGMCQAILEALAMGVPVLAREIPGNQELLTNRQTGLLFSTPQLFHDCAVQLIASARFRANLITRAFDYVRDEHRWDVEVRFYRETVEAMCSSP